MAVHQFCDFTEQRYAKGVQLDEFEFVLERLSAADKDTLKAFYVARQGEFDTAWTLVFDGVTYPHCQFVGEFAPVLNQEVLWDVRLKIRSRAVVA